jgi:energy-coupling factor transporter ATP-binding protein EcfA2
MDDDSKQGPRTVVVGPCASGKTTLVNNLRCLGYNIHSCAQEHSSARRLWTARCRAEVLVYLDAELETIARRQNRTDWTTRRLEAQRARLADARAHCDFYLQTDDLTREEVARAVDAFLFKQGIPRTRDIVQDKGSSDD